MPGGIAGNPRTRPDRSSSMWSASDEALLAGLAAGDAVAATAFIRRYQRRVYGLAVVIVGDRAVAEEVAQEALVRAWRHAGAYDPRRGSVATWLLTITRNLSIDALRLHRSDPIDPDTLAALDLRDRAPDPADAAAARVEADRLRDAIADLPPDQQRALVLAAFRGRTAREIGELDGIPIGTAKTRIRSAMLRLRAALVEGSAS